MVCKWVLLVSSVSNEILTGLTLNRFGKRARVRLHGGSKYGSILSCSASLYLAILSKVVVFLLLRFFELLGLGGRGGGDVESCPFLHWSGRRWMMAFERGSLLKRIAHRLVCSSTWCFIGGMDASTSSAAVGEVLNAAHMRYNARL